MPRPVRFLPSVFLCLLLGGVSTAARAVDAALDVNDNAARAYVGVPLSNNILVDSSWLYHADNGHVFSVGGHVTGAASGVDPLRAGLGLRFSYVSNDRESEEDGTALGLGGFVRYRMDRAPLWVWLVGAAGLGLIITAGIAGGRRSPRTYPSAP